MKTSILIGLLITTSVLGDTAAKKRLLDSIDRQPSSRRPQQDRVVRLYDIINHRAVRVGDPEHLPPYRMHLVPNPDAPKDSAYVMTDGDGNLPDPLELVRGGSIFWGAALGAKYPQQNYELTAEGTWVPTTRLEHYYFWLVSNPRQVKTVNWRKLDVPLRDPVTPIQELELYEITLHRGKPARRDQALEPWRVYRARGAKTEPWRYILTNGNGRPERPDEWLLPGSVLSGDTLGVHGTNYELGTDRRWKATLKPQRLYFYSPAIPGKLKIVDFLKPRH